MTSSFDLAALRSRFASLPTLTYLSSGSYGLLADSVRAAFDDYLDGRVARGADWGGWVGTLETLRARMATLLAVDADEVAITGSASAGLNALASALDFSGTRRRIVVTEFDFPTGAQIWHAQERAGAEIVHIAESSEGMLPLDAILAAIDERTAVVALSQLCYRHGGRTPDDDIRAIVEKAHAAGAIVVLDSFQIIGTEPIHPRDLGVDICVGGMLKYLLGTAGVGYLYVRRELIERLVPKASGWFAQADINAMDIFANQPSPTARRFEAGTPPVPSCVAAVAGIDLILEIGLDTIAKQVRDVTRYTLDALRGQGIAYSNPDEDRRRGPLVSIPTTDEQALVGALAARNVVTSNRDGRLRAGFHVYNNREDADAFVAALRDNRHLLRN